jgi:hypothetical protein
LVRVKRGRLLPIGWPVNSIAQKSFCYDGLKRQLGVACEFLLSRLKANFRFSTCSTHQLAPISASTSHR